MRYLVRIKGLTQEGNFSFEETLEKMRSLPYNKLIKRDLFEVLLLDGRIHYTDIRS